MKTVLVTGSAGFIGHRVAHFLLDEGVNVIGLDNINDAYDKRLKHHRQETLKDRRGFTFTRPTSRISASSSPSSKSIPST